MNRNYCLELASVAAYNMQKVNGTTDSNRLMGNVYLIMFMNYYCDTYCFDALDALKHTKHYKHEIKRYAKQALDFIDNHNNVICKHLAEFQDKFADINLRIDEAFTGRIKKLELNINKMQQESDGNADEEKTKIIIATMLAEFATKYLKDIVESDKKENPIITQVSWISHAKLAKYLEHICDYIKIPDRVLNDIHVYDTWAQFKNKWYDPVFMAGVLGIEDQSEENVEIKSSIMAKKS